MTAQPVTTSHGMVCPGGTPGEPEGQDGRADFVLVGKGQKVNVRQDIIIVTRSQRPPGRGKSSFVSGTRG